MINRAESLIKPTACAAAGGALGLAVGYTINGESLCQQVVPGLFDKSITASPAFLEFMRSAVTSEFNLMRDILWDSVRNNPNPSPVYGMLAENGIMTRETQITMYRIAHQTMKYLLATSNSTFVAACVNALRPAAYLPQVIATGTLLGLAFGVAYEYFNATPDTQEEQNESDSEAAESSDEIQTPSPAKLYKSSSSPTLFSRKSELLSLKENFGDTVRDLNKYIEDSEAPKRPVRANSK